MYPDRLYELAFEFRKTKLWKSMYDSEMFAVSLPNGGIGYCCVMGFLGEHLALALYIGNEGLDSFRQMQGMNEFEINPLKAHEIMFGQKCLQCAFENKDMLAPPELSAVKAYTSSHKITLRGANSFPQFVCYQPACYPWPVHEQEDIQLLCAALEAGIEVSRKLKETNKALLGFREGDAYDRDIPLLTPSEEGFTWGLHPLPPRMPVQYPEPVLQDELLTMRLKKTKKRQGTWACDMVMLPVPSVDDEGAVPVFPYTLLLAVCETGTVLPTTVEADGEGRDDAFLQALGNRMLENGIPRKIIVMNERTQTLLKNLAATLKIQLVMEPDNELLEEMETDFLEYFNTGSPEETEEEFDLFNDMLMSLDDTALLTMPDELWENLYSMACAGELDEELSQRILKLKKRRK